VSLRPLRSNATILVAILYVSRIGFPGNLGGNPPPLLLIHSARVSISSLPLARSSRRRPTTWPTYFPEKALVQNENEAAAPPAEISFAIGVIRRPFLIASTLIKISRDEPGGIRTGHCGHKRRSIANNKA
jgi:hypothetical protein